MQIGRYEVLGELARGGMGVVYRARDPLLDREVALKLVLAEAGDPHLQRALQRFRIEARAASRVRHANVVGVQGLGEHQGRPFLVMDLVEGESLAARLKRAGPFPPREAAGVAARLARALAAAHAEGVLHRDVKPENVLVTPAGEPVLVDFGLALVLDARTRLSRTGDVMGTARTMPPEQAEGDLRALGPASDIYSLGATLYELLCGRPAFQAPTTLQVLSLVLSKPPPPLRAQVPRLDPDLEAICLRCLEKRPADRWPSATALADALEAWLRGGQAAPGTRGRPRGRLLTVGLALTSAALGAVALGLGLALLRVRGERDALRAELARRPAAPAPEAPPPTSPAPPAAEEPRELLRRGLERWRVGHDADGALADLSRALELDPELYEARAARGHLRYLLNDLAGTEADAGAALAQRPDLYDGYYLRGLARVERGEPAAALADLRHAGELAPDSAAVFTALAKALGRTGDAQGSLVALDRALELDPRQGEAAGLRSLLRLDRQDWAGARQDADVAVRELPDSSAGWHASGYTALAEGDLERAEREITRALELAPQSAPVFLLIRGSARRRMGKAAEARQDLERALAGTEPGGPFPRLRPQVQSELEKLGP